MKNLYTDASFDWTKTDESNENVVRGKIAIQGEGLEIIEKVAIGKVPSLKQYINVFELVAIARAVEISKQRRWDEEDDLYIRTDSKVAMTWATNGINPELMTDAHKNALEYFRKVRGEHKTEVIIDFVKRDYNPAGHLLQADLEQEKKNGATK